MSKALGKDDRINERNFFQQTYNRIIAFESSTNGYSSTPRVLKSSSSKKRNIDTLSKHDPKDLLDIINKCCTNGECDRPQQAFELDDDYAGRFDVIVNKSQRATSALFDLGYNVKLQDGRFILHHIKPVND
jgi:hypothetical protein